MNFLKPSVGSTRPYARPTWITPVAESGPATFRDRLDTDLSPSETDQETSSLITADSLVPKLVREFAHLKDLMIRVGLREP